MPELPEVETVARTLAPQIQGCVVESSLVLRPGSVHRLSLPMHSLHGRRIVGTGRRGKLLLLHLDQETTDPQVPHCLVIHLRMTGRIMTWPGDTPPGPHTRCIWGVRTPQGLRRQLFFDDTRAFGLVLAATPDILQVWDFWRQLGPEPLNLSPETFMSILAARKGAIKAVLLDQKAIAGIGNIYADEGLFRARIAPDRRASGLTGREAVRLLHALQEVLRLSIAQCGSSIRDYRDANGDVGAFQNSFAVYGRSGQPCTVCGRVLSKTRLAGRGTVFCQYCQQ